MADDLYCKVYLKGPEPGPSRPAMQAALIAAVGGRFENRTLRAKGLVIDLIPNTDGRGEADFIGWPFYLEINAEPEVVQETHFVAALRELLAGLRAQSIQVVPSCDFEDQLEEFSCP